MLTIFQCIGHKVSGHITVGKIKVDFINSGQINSKVFEYGVRFKIMIAGKDLLTTVSSPGKRSNVDIGLGINGKPQDAVKFIRHPIGHIDM